jgi:hypothetical protein
MKLFEIYLSVYNEEKKSFTTPIQVIPISQTTPDIENMLCHNSENKLGSKLIWERRH